MLWRMPLGRLKGRWRSLKKRNDTDVKFLPNLATAHCVLHNICETHGDEFDEDRFVPEAATEAQLQLLQ